MLKKKFIILLVTLISLLMAGCFSDPVKDDLEEYVNEGILPLMSDEEEILSLYGSVTGNNYTDDYVLYETIQSDIIPKYQNFITAIEDIRPKTSEVRELHEIYIKASNDQYNAMIMILDAIEYQDHGVIKEANEKLDGARRLMRDFQYELEELLDNHNLEIE